MLKLLNIKNKNKLFVHCRYLSGRGRNSKESFCKASNSSSLLEVD